MKTLYRVVIILIILSGCKGSKVVSDTNTTVQDLKVTQREYVLEIGKRSVIDTTDIFRLKKGEIITKKDPATGIKIKHQLKDNNLITEVVVPPIKEVITVADTTKTITNNRHTVTEERYNLWDKLNDLINLGFWLLIIFLVILVVIRILK